jgi:cytochrome P450
MNAPEPKIRQFCANVLDLLVGAERFDFVRASVRSPMRAIGMLLGIPEADQESIRNVMTTGSATRPDATGVRRAQSADAAFADHIEWRAEPPTT